MINSHLLLEILTNNSIKKRKIYKTFSRETMILPEFIGQKIATYNGKVFKLRTISLNMLKHKLGEFSNTRLIHIFKQKKQRRKKK